MRKYKILFDASYLVDKNSGESQYVLNILNSFNKLIPNIFDFTFIINLKINNRSFYSYIPNFKFSFIIHPIKVKSAGPMRDLLYFRILNDIKNYDLFFCPTEKWPLCANRGVFVLHDARMFDKRFPGLNFLKRFYMKSTIKRGIFSSNHIISVSKSSLNEYSKFTKINFHFKSTVINHYCNEDRIFNIKNIRNEIQKFKSKKYFLYYGQIWRPHKNIFRHIIAFNKFLEKNNYENIYFVVGGLDKGILNKILPKRNIEYFGYLNEDERKFLLTHTEALIYLSLFEGFGLPILDALQMGKKVLISDIEVFRELFSDGVMFVDPRDTNLIAKKMENILNKQQNIEIAKIYQSKYNETKFAYKHYKVFQNVIREYEN